MSDVLAVGEFPTLEQVSILAKAGFKSILNTQPDGEVARFDSDAAIAAEAKRNGLAHAYAPLSSRTPPEGELARYAAAIEALPAPIYAFCYSGSRSAAAFGLLLTASMDVETIVSQFAEAGFDLAGIKPWLDEARARHVSERGAAAGGKPATASAIPPRPAPASKPAAEPQFQRAPAAAGLPSMVVVQPRAAGFGGFAT
ncbi:MAG: sulfur transferase domain-containing protein [Hyphomicrobiaceae bacterium]